MSTAKKDFRDDLLQFEQRLAARQPFTITRFGDGELTVFRGKPIDLGDGEFAYDPSNSTDRASRRFLHAALTYEGENYFVGIGCPCCIGPEQFEWLRQLSGQTEERL